MLMQIYTYTDTFCSFQQFQPRVFILMEAKMLQISEWKANLITKHQTIRALQSKKRECLCMLYTSNFINNYSQGEYIPIYIYSSQIFLGHKERCVRMYLAVMIKSCTRTQKKPIRNVSWEREKSIYSSRPCIDGLFPCHNAKTWLFHG